jgi:hypothetical protein
MLAMKRRAPLLRLDLLGCTALLIGMAGCSLVSIKSPERPLSTRDLNARILTRELSSEFVVAVAHCGRDIVATESDSTVVDNTLRWEIGAVAESRRAALQMAPMLGLLDTWAFALQQQAFLADGAAGGALFGTHQAAVRKVAADYADGTEQLARSLLSSQEFAEYRQFVAGYASAYPLRDLAFERVSVVVLWSREKGGATKLVDSLGTVPESLSDMGQRLEIYGDTVPMQVMRETQLALREAGYTNGGLRASLSELDDRLTRLAAVAESTPDLVHGAIADVRASLREVLDRMDASSRAATATLTRERITLFADVRLERAAVMAALDGERQALAADAARIAAQVVKTGGEQVRYLAREAVALIIVLFIVLFGVPFAAGYFVGRARRTRALGSS